MTAPGPLFRVRRNDAGEIEILPHADAWLAHHNTSWVLFAIWAAVIAWWLPNAYGLAFVGLPALAALSIRFVNGRLRRQNEMPLVIGPDHSITYGSERIFNGREVGHVRIVQQQNFDDPDSFGVTVVPRQGAPIAMPYPYFDHLSPTEGAALAVALAKALDTTVVRGPVAARVRTHMSRIFRKAKSAA